MNIGSDGMKTVEWDIHRKHSINNIGLITGIPGTGKTSLIRKCACDATQEGISAVLFDFSDSYRMENILFPEEKLVYHNVERSGLGINPFQRQIRYIDGNPEQEGDEHIVYRILNILVHGLKIRGSKQQMKLQEYIFKLIAEEGKAASFPYLYVLLEGTELGEKIRCLKNSRLYSNKINWKELLSDGRVVIIQLSDVAPWLRYLFAELILYDLWAETIKGELGTYFLCIDEIQHLRFDNASVMQSLLRESRKYSVAMLLATQFLGDMKNQNARLLLEQASQRFYFKQPDKKLTAIAKSIDEVNYQRWKQTIRELKVGEYVFAGNGVVDGKAYDLKCRLNFDLD